MIPSEPAILVPNPSSQTKVQRAKHSMHIRSSEFTIVVDPASCLRSQYNSNLDDSPDLDNSGFKCKTKKVKRSVYFLFRDLWLLTGMAIYYLRFTLIKL